MRWPVTAAIAVLLTLGGWQLQRRSEKLDLIARVEQRLSSPPVPVPRPALWAEVGADTAYTRVYAVGRYRMRAETRVQAVTRYGGGYWVLTPLETGAFTVLVNRGFVPTSYRGRIAPPGGVIEVSGLLRMSEPGGGFLRRNAPTADRWYSRDVAAIARKRGLERSAPYFVDAGRGAISVPRGGLTTVRFANNHLLYALTWFACAAGLAVLAWKARREKVTRRRPVRRTPSSNGRTSAAKSPSG